jgi:alpha-ketoglutarate-dependent taurine dioxygenase
VATALGAEVDGVDLARGLSDEDVGAIRGALLDHKVLFFRDQALDPAGLTALGSRFGQPTPAHPVEPSLPGHPEVLPLDSDDGARADVWHSDLTFQPRPPLGAMLHATTVPDVGGDTLWADMAAAHDALSPVLRTFLAGLSATHAATKAGGYFRQRDAEGDKATRTAAEEPVHHPVVRIHPESGRPSLFVNPLFTLRIDGLHREESRLLLRHLQEVATAPERVVRWRWRNGDVAFWDNRCTMHYALLDFGPARRRMERVALEGDVPVGLDARDPPDGAQPAPRGLMEG